ncbi:UDP-glycosyltransferase UGT5-like [Artemia franciscana]|uniref:Glucuronosyltransferase n=1 Tax=Artemia franciscana TaxID=6661 RepID=A0AA88LE42_ARTSF|nr:hypothetical protein QYM36_003617 [Artemia franciscana]
MDLSWFIFMTLVNFSSAARIVAFSCSGTPSHKYVAEPLFELLVKKGHDVTVITSFPARSVPLFKEINIGMQLNVVFDSYLTKRLKSEFIIPIEAMLETFPKLLTEGFEKTWNNPDFQQLLNSTVDLVIIDSVLNEFALGFVHLWDTQLVYLASVPNVHHNFHAVGQQFDYSLYSFMTTTKSPPFGFLDRVQQFVFGEMARAFRQRDIMKVEKMLGEHVPGVPPFLEIERGRTALILGNFDDIITEPHPIPPNYVKIGAMTCKPPKPLPKDVESFIARSEDEGFAIFSLGTGLVMSSMPQETKEAFINVFKRYKLHVIWKWENISIFGEVPDNVYLSQWLPSLNDLLGHPKARIYMSHGGLIGVQEAIYHGVPIIGLPVFADQDNNVRRIERNGNGRLLEWKGITETKIDKAVKSVLYDPKYRQNAKKYSKMAKSPLTNWKQTAMHYINMVLENDNVDFMKVETSHIYGFQRHLFDVYLFFLIFFIFIIYCIYVLIKKIRLVKRKHKQD